jgi:hypothetical protein
MVSGLLSFVGRAPEGAGNWERKPRIWFGASQAHPQSRFLSQVVPVAQSPPRGVNCELNALHVCALSGEDVQRPVGITCAIDLMLNLNGRHMLAAPESPDFLQCDER